MANRKKSTLSGTALKGLVTIAFAEDVDLAKQYKQMLLENDIPAAIKARGDQESGIKGVPVLVPEEYIDEAHVLINSHSSMGDFYNVTFEDENERDYFSYDPDFEDNPY